MFEALEARSKLPMVGYKAPDFEAKTTFGDMKLSDLEGRWVVFFCHPSDFTPVCTTEFIAFARYYPYFLQRNVQLLGLSVDSTYSHLSWVYNIYKNTGIEILFPIIADRSMEISKLYGMISHAVSDTSTIRSVFIIDDKQVIRTVLHYPQTIGRCIPEILRIVDALQTSDREKVATPANWVPGAPVVLPAPDTYEKLKERIKNPSGYNCMDWYLCTKPDKGLPVPEKKQ